MIFTLRTNILNYDLFKKTFKIEFKKLISSLEIKFDINSLSNNQ